MSEILKKPYPLGFLLTSSPLLLQSQMLIAVSEGLWGQDRIPIPWYLSLSASSHSAGLVCGWELMVHRGSGTASPSQVGLAAQERKGEPSGIIRHTGFADDMMKKSGKWCVTDGLGSPVPL